MNQILVGGYGKNVDGLDLGFEIKSEDVENRNGIYNSISTTIRNIIFSDVQVLQIKIRIFKPENRKS